MRLPWPFKYPIIGVASDGKFGRLGPFDYYIKNGKKIPLPHQGSDYRIPNRTPLFAPGPGRVDIRENNSFGYGIYIRILLDNGYRIGFAHLSEGLVGLNARVSEGQLIGYTGNSGTGSGYHCHVELRAIGGSPVIDPEKNIQWYVPQQGGDNSMIDDRERLRAAVYVTEGHGESEADWKEYLAIKQANPNAGPWTLVQQKYLYPKYNSYQGQINALTERVNQMETELKLLQETNKGILNERNELQNDKAKLSEQVANLEKKVAELTSQVPPRPKYTLFDIIMRLFGVKGVSS